MADTLNPGEFSFKNGQVVKFGDEATAMQPGEIKWNAPGPVETAGFLGAPTADTYGGSREGDFGDSFAGDVYRNNALVRKGYDSVANEYDALNASVGGNYKDEIFFGNNPHEIFAGWDINRTESLDDKQRKFKEYFPEGNMRVVPYNGQKYILARQNATSPWVKLGTNVVDKVISGAVSGATVGGLVGEAIGSSTIPVVGTAIGAGLGAMAGEVADRAVEKYVRGGLKEESLVTPGTLVTGATNAAISWWGGGGTPGAMKGLFKDTPTQRAIDAAAFAEAEGLPNITMGQASTNPIISTWFKQATSLDATTRQKAIDSNLSAVARFNNFINNATGNTSLDGNVLSQILGMARYNLNAIISGMRNKEIPSADGMAKLKSAFENWDNIVAGKNGAIDQAFDKALSLSDDVSFDLSAARKTVNEIIDGVEGAGEKTTTRMRVGSAEPTRDTPRGTTMVPVTTTQEVPIKLSEDPKGELLSAMQAIQDLKGDVVTNYTNPSTGNEFNAYKQVKTLITRFGRLTESPDPGVSGPAKQVYGALKQSLDTAEINTSGLPPEKATAFTEAWSKARTLFKDYLELKDQKVISRLDNMDITDYQSAADNIVRPGNARVLRTVSEVLPEGRDILRGIFYNKLFAGERNAFDWENSVRKELTRYTNAGDKESLDLLLKPGEQANLIKYAKMREQLETSVLPKLAESDASASQLAFETVTRGDGEALNTILQVAGGRNSNAGQAVRRGILQRIYEDSTVNLQGRGDIFNYQKFKDALEVYSNNGTLGKLFNNNEIEWLTNLDKYVDMVHINPDAGVSLQTAAIASGIASHAAKGAIQASEGNVEKGIGTVAKSFILPITYKMGGAWFLNGAKSFSNAGRQAATSGVRKTANDIAWKTTATLLGKQDLNEDTSITTDVITRVPWKGARATPAPNALTKYGK